MGLWDFAAVAQPTFKALNIYIFNILCYIFKIVM